jgi:hypothetical protein
VKIDVDGRTSCGLRLQSNRSIIRSCSLGPAFKIVPLAETDFLYIHSVERQERSPHYEHPTYQTHTV